MSSQPAHPLVSLCTVTHNRHHLLPRLMECIQSQDYPASRMEWIICDDSESSLNTDSLDNESGIEINYYWSNRKISLGSKRNQANNISQGDIIILLDDDDFYPITRVSHAVDTLINTNFLVAGCSETLILYLDVGQLWVNGPYGQGFSLANSMAYRKEVLDSTEFDPKSTFNEERSFLKNYTLPMAQLDPTKTIICISHNDNTANSAQLRLDQLSGETNLNLKPFSFASKSQEEAIAILYKSYFELHETLK